MNVVGIIIMGDMMRRSFGHYFKSETSESKTDYDLQKRHIFTDPNDKQNINPWKMKLLSCLTLGVIGHNMYCIWIMTTSEAGFMRVSDWFSFQPTASTRNSTMLSITQTD